MPMYYYAVSWIVIPHNADVLHCGQRCQNWLKEFYSSCLNKLTIPKIWRRATIIALPKPNKPTDNPKNYSPISLLCVPFKVLERLLLARLDPIVDPHLPNQQAGFRRGHSAVHQIVKLTNDIVESFEKRHKAGVVLVDLTAAYDTVWHQGLTLKLLRSAPDRHLVRFLCTILSNRSFILKTSDRQASRPRRLRNGVPQGSVLAPMLFNIIHQRPAPHNIKAVRICGWPRPPILGQKLDDSREDTNLRHGTNSNSRVPENLETKTECCENNFHSLPSQHQGGPPQTHSKRQRVTTAAQPNSHIPRSKTRQAADVQTTSRFTAC